MSSPAITSTSQLFLNLYDITNDLIILDDGSVAMVITVSAMNFGLLSEDEQDATIYAYAGLLNSLSFPTQIVIRSQPKDVSVYLRVISQKEQETTNPLYKRRIKSYREFVESLVQEQNVLDKKFYFVIPLSAVEMGFTPASVLPGAKAKPITSYDKSFIIEKAKTNLEPRRDHLIDQLARLGLYSRQLTTQELIQMLYSSYNPESFEGQKITDTQNYTTPLVQAQFQTTPTVTELPPMPQPTPEPEPEPESQLQPQPVVESQPIQEPLAPTIPSQETPTPDFQPQPETPTSQPPVSIPSIPVEPEVQTNLSQSDQPAIPPLPDEQTQINQTLDQANIMAQQVNVDPTLIEPTQQS